MKKIFLFLCLLFFVGCSNKISFKEIMPNFYINNHFDGTVKVITSGALVKEATVDQTQAISYLDIDKAIVNSINRSRLFTRVVDTNPDYILEAFIVNLSHPLMGRNYDTSLEIAWVLRKQNNVLLRKSITTTAFDTSSAFSAVSHLRAAIISAFRENIVVALKEVEQLLK